MRRTDSDRGPKSGIIQHHNVTLTGFLEQKDYSVCIALNHFVEEAGEEVYAGNGDDKKLRDLEYERAEVNHSIVLSGPAKLEIVLNPRNE